MFNHSCEPNAAWGLEGALMTFRAKTHVQAGDTLEISYLNNEELGKDVEERRARYRVS